MRIVIDMQGIQTQSRLRGIGRYTFSFVKEMIKSHKKHEFILVLNGEFSETVESIRTDFDEVLQQNNIRVWESLSPVSALEPQNAWRIKASEFIRENFIESLSPDFVLITTLFEGFDDDFVASVHLINHSAPTAIILYDLIPLMNREKYLADSRAYAWYMNKIDFCKKADLLLAISESARQEAIEYLDVNEKNIINISTACNAIFCHRDLSENDQNVLKEKFGISRNILMFSGATDERKNLIRLIEAYSKLSDDIRNKYHLVFVGGLPDLHRNNFIAHAKHCGLGLDDLIITGRVSDEEMSAFYNIATAFVFPSWHEGFGLPVLEAMNSGCPAIVSNTSSLPEVVGIEDALLDPFDVDSIAMKIEKVLIDKEFRLELQQHGIKQAKKFSWKITANQAIEAIENFTKENNANVKRIDAKSLDNMLINQLVELDEISDDTDIHNAAFAIAQNRQEKVKQLFVDVSELAMNPTRQTGIQRVVRGILKELLLNPPKDYRVEPVYARIVEGYCYAREFKNNFLGLDHKNVHDEPIEFNYQDIFLGLDLVHPKVLKKDFYQYMRKHGVLVYFILYDLLPVQFPLYTESTIRTLFHDWLNVVCQSDGVICISEDSSEQLKNYLKTKEIDRLRPLDVSWFHIGVNKKNDSFNMNDLSSIEQDTLKIINENDTFLMVGTLEPRKGHQQTLESFEKLWEDGIDVNLVIVGKEGWLVDELIEKLRSHVELNKKLFWLEGVSDEYLDKIYEASTCLIMASEGEGFGLPLIEAAQRKIPIIARDVAVFKEVAGEHAYYFVNDKDPNIIADAVKNWLQLYKSESHPKSDDMPWVTWEESTKQLLSWMKI